MCDKSLTKCLLFAFNFVIWLIGLFMTAIGLWAFIDPQNFMTTAMRLGDDAGDSFQQVTTYLTIMSVFVLALGAVISIIAMFGCCGAIRESKCCLGIFFTLLLLCFLVTIVLGGFILFVAATGKSNDDTSTYIRGMFDTIVSWMWSTMSKEDRRAFEQANQCCDVNSNALVNTLDKMECSITGLTTRNCKDFLIDSVQQKFFIAGGVILGVALVELIGMIMACILFNRAGYHYSAV